MTKLLNKTLLAAAIIGVASATPAIAQLRGGASAGEAIVFKDPGFRGQALTIDGAIRNLAEARFNDTISSIQVRGTWELCVDPDYRGKCTVIDGSVRKLSDIRFNDNVTSMRPLGGGRRGDRPRGDRPRGDRGSDRAQVVLFDREGFGGERIGIDGNVPYLKNVGFNDRARSVKVRSGVWLLCEDPNGRGRCEYVDRNVRDLRDIGLTGRISSISPTVYKKGPDNHAISLFKHPDMRGAFLGFDGAVPNLNQYRFNDTASSIQINSGRWLVCEDPNYRGFCEVIGSSVWELKDLSLNDRISSLRPYNRRRDRNSGNRRNRGNDYGYNTPRPRNAGYGGGQSYDSYQFDNPRDRYGDRILATNRNAREFCRDNGYKRVDEIEANGSYLGCVICSR